jgi:hypothetical protein
MGRLERDLRNLLNELELIEPVTLGKRQRRPVSAAHAAKLDALLASQRLFNNRLVVVAVCMVVGVFLLSVFFTLYHRDNPAMLPVAFGGNLLSILVTVGWVRTLWIEKGHLDLASVAIAQLPPEEAIRLASSLYWHLLSQRQGGTSLPQASRPDESTS